MAKQKHVLIAGRFALGAAHRHYGSWRFRIRDLETGKVWKRSVRERSKRTARDEVIRWLEREAKRLEAHASPGGIRAVEFEAAFGEFLELLPAISPRRPREITLRTYKWDADGVIIPAFKGRLVHEIRRADVERFRRDLQAAEKSARTVAKHTALLRRFFKWAEDNDHTDRDPTRNLRLAGWNRVGRALTEDEAQRLIAAAARETKMEMKDRRREWTQKMGDRRHLRIAILIALYTGLRKSNVLGLRWRQVDLGAGVIRVPASEMKGRRDHEVPIHPVLRRVLREALQGAKFDPDAAVIGREVAGVRASFLSASKEAGLEGLRFHDLRHTFGTWLATRCCHAVHQRLLAHAPRDVTDGYVHRVDRAELVRAIGALPDLTVEGGENQVKKVDGR